MTEDVRETWGRYSAAFAAEGEAAERRDSIKRLIELCELPAGGLLLDVATGAGYTAFAFARTGVRVVPSDPTHEMLLATRQGWVERGLPGEARCVESWAEALPFRDASLDAVVAHRAPHQFADAGAWAADAHRVLKPGGVFGLADQSPPDGWEDWHNHLERTRDPTHERARSPREWREIGEVAGFTVRATDTVYQSHDLEDWMDRVDCPEERRLAVREMFANVPDAIRDVYRPEQAGGRWRFRTPQHVLVCVK